MDVDEAAKKPAKKAEMIKRRGQDAGTQESRCVDAEPLYYEG